MLAEAVSTVDDGVFCWPFLPTLNLMTTHMIVMLTARITAITTSPITDARRGISIMLLNEEYVGGMLVMLVGIRIEVLETVVVTIAVTIEVASAGILSLLVVILHSSMKS